MKVVKVITVLVFGPLLGAIAGFVLGIVAMPSPTPSGGSPGDGILIMGCVGLGTLVSLLVSAALAWRMWFKSGVGPRQD